MLQVKREVRRGVKDIIQKVGITSILVTHDRDEAFDIADKVVVFNRSALSYTFQILNPFPYTVKICKEAALFKGESTLRGAL